MSDDLFEHNWDDTNNQDSQESNVTYPNPLDVNSVGSPVAHHPDDLDLEDYTGDEDVVTDGIDRLAHAGVSNDDIADVIEDKKADRERDDQLYTKKDILAIFKIYEHLISSDDEYKRIFSNFMGKRTMNDIDLAISVTTGDDQDTLQQSRDIAQLVIDTAKLYDSTHGDELPLKDAFALASRVDTFDRQDLQYLARGLNRFAKDVSTEDHPIGGMSAARNLTAMDVSASFMETMKGISQSGRHHDFIDWLSTTVSRLG